MSWFSKSVTVPVDHVEEARANVVAALDAFEAARVDLQEAALVYQDKVTENQNWIARLQQDNADLQFEAARALRVSDKLGELTA